MGKHYGNLIINDVLKMKKDGYTNKQIGEKYSLTLDQIKHLVKRYNRSQRKILNGILPMKRGRPRKDAVKNREDKIEYLNRQIAHKNDEIKQLKMQNELLKDFLQELERK